MRYTWFFLLLLGLTACTYTAKITDGATAVERKQYKVAVPMLQREYKKAKSRKDKGVIALDLGRSFVEIGDDASALDWFQKAYDNNAGTEALEMKADAQKRLELFEDAIQTYTDLGFEIGSKYEFRKQIAGAEQALKWRDQEKKGKEREYVVEPTAFNTRQADYGPVVFENRLVFTSDRSAATGEETYNWTGRGFTDLFVVDPVAGGTPEPYDKRTNTPDHEGTPTFSQDGKLMIFTRCSSPAKYEDGFCGLYYSEREATAWGAAKQVPFVKEGANYMHPTLSTNGKKLYFSALLEEGWGGYDIYVSNRKEDGTWNDPILMNRAINTQGNEQFPSLDGDTLYFASDGHEGMGGLDIFKTHPLVNGRFKAVKNLQPPVNSGADDFGFTILRRSGSGLGETTTGYFSSSRPGGQGSDDIYAYTKRELPPPPVDPTPIEYKNVLDVYVVEKIYEEPGNPRSRVLGRRPVPNASIIAKVGEQSRTVNANDEGKLSLVLVDDQQYDFRADREEYLAAEGRFSSINLPKDPDAPEQRYELELELDKIFRNQEIVLENIYYDFDESFIRADAQPTLNELASLLKRNPTINIELSSHTDCVGKDSYNETLSQARAQAAVTYLIEQGVDEARLTARGYGENDPVVQCICERCSDEENQRNRRTGFRVLE
jgi:outer membrane protein OmpA-like peptidoglycan-associated protein